MKRTATTTTRSRRRRRYIMHWTLLSTITKAFGSGVWVHVSESAVPEKESKGEKKRKAHVSNIHINTKLNTEPYEWIKTTTTTAEKWISWFSCIERERAAVPEPFDCFIYRILFDGLCVFSSAFRNLLAYYCQQSQRAITLFRLICLRQLNYTLYPFSWIWYSQFNRYIRIIRMYINRDDTLQWTLRERTNTQIYEHTLAPHCIRNATYIKHSASTTKNIMKKSTNEQKSAIGTERANILYLGISSNDISRCCCCRWIEPQ